MEEREKTGRAIIIINDKLLSIKRTKIVNGKEFVYYTIPGGHLEENESYEEATIREIKEELGITVEIKQELLYIFNKDLCRYEKFFLCKYISGEIGTGTGEEWNCNTELYGNYDICYLNIENLGDYNLLPREIKDIISKIEKNT